jgi:hypothetical protein
MRKSTKTDRKNGKGKDKAPQLAPFRWKPGVSGNPTGRPKKKPISEAYEAAVNDPLPEELRKFKLGRREIELSEGATFADLIALGQAVSAMRGNTAAAREIADRLEGRVTEKIDATVSLSWLEQFRRAEERMAAKEKQQGRAAESENPGSAGANNEQSN